MDLSGNGNDAILSGMITPVDNILCGPLNANKVNIENTLLKNIGYSSEILPNGFVSRNVNISVNENENNVHFITLRVL